jgi:hypothetical protein
MDQGQAARRNCIEAAPVVSFSCLQGLLLYNFTAQAKDRVAVGRHDDFSSYVDGDLSLLSPIHHRAVVFVISLGILPVMSDLVGQGVFIELDAEARARRQIEIAVPHHKWFLQIAMA